MSTMVSSPALQPLHQMHISSISVREFNSSSVTVEMSLEGLSSLALCQATTTNETSFKNQKALVCGLDKMYDMKPEHDD